MDVRVGEVPCQQSLSAIYKPARCISAGGRDGAAGRVPLICVWIWVLLYPVLSECGKNIFKQGLVRWDLTTVLVVVSVQCQVQEGLNLFVGQPLSAGIIITIFLSFCLANDK